MPRQCRSHMEPRQETSRSGSLLASSAKQRLGLPSESVSDSSIKAAAPFSHPTGPHVVHWSVRAADKVLCYPNSTEAQGMEASSILRKHRHRKSTWRCNRGIFLMLLRGEVFRHGGSGLRLGTSDQNSARAASDTKQQLDALASIRIQIIRPAAKLGWSPVLFADLLCPRRLHGKLRTALKKELQMSDSAAIRIQDPSARLKSQAAAIVSGLVWSTARAAKLNGWPRYWSILFMLRADLEVKLPLAMPPPMAVGHSIIVPFHCADVPFTHQFGRPTVADVVHMVPRGRLPELLRALHAHLGYGSLHQLCDWLNDVRYFVPSRHDANSEQEWNP